MKVHAIVGRYMPKVEFLILLMHAHIEQIAFVAMLVFVRFLTHALGQPSNAARRRILEPLPAGSVAKSQPLLRAHDVWRFLADQAILVMVVFALLVDKANGFSHDVVSAE